MKLTEKEQKMCDDAVIFVKENKKMLIAKFADSEKYSTRKEPISIFMAGIPGAGKTEVAKRLIEETKINPVHIDADEIRELFRKIGYNGKNSYIFQKACSHGVDKLFDYVQSKKLHSIIDGTFASDNSMKNIERSLGRDRKVFIYYIYQNPIIAWKIVKGRENLEGRSIPKEAFIDSYFKSMENVNKAKNNFTENIKLNILFKNAESNLEKQVLNIYNIDYYVEKIYNESELRKIIL